jgi:hypothetical protein
VGINRDFNPFTFILLITDLLVVAGKNQNTKLVNRAFENVAKYRHFANDREKNQNLINEENKSIINSSNACYHSDQNCFSFHPLHEIVKTKIHKIIILPIILYGCETLSLTLREDPRGIQ